MKKISRTIMRALATMGALASVTVAGCDLNKALSVQPANLIPAVALETPENATLLATGAASDFDCAFNSYVVVGGLLGVRRMEPAAHRRSLLRDRLLDDQR